MNVNRSFAHLLRATHREDPSGLSDVAMWSDSLPAFKVAAKALFDTGLYSATEIEDANGHVLIAYGYDLDNEIVPLTLNEILRHGQGGGTHGPRNDQRDLECPVCNWLASQRETVQIVEARS